MDLAPALRWAEVGKEYSKQLKTTLDTIIAVINKIDDKIVPYLERVRLFVLT